MFGRSRPVLFDPYRSRRSRWRPPRWLVLLFCGTAIGAGGVVLVQERYLPPRLSADESARLRGAFDEAEAARLRLRGELAQSNQQLQAALADRKNATERLGAGTAAVERARADLAAVVASLPPDPRGGQVEIRGARFAARGNTLTYDVVLTRERATGNPLAGSVQFAVTGQTARGVEATLPPQSVPVSVGTHEVVHGSLSLPDGFKPRQTTIQVLDRSGSRSLGMRVWLVK